MKTIVLEHEIFTCDIWTKHLNEFHYLVKEFNWYNVQQELLSYKISSKEKKNLRQSINFESRINVSDKYVITYYYSTGKNFITKMF